MRHAQPHSHLLGEAQLRPGGLRGPTPTRRGGKAGLRHPGDLCDRFLSLPRPLCRGSLCGRGGPARVGLAWLRSGRGAAAAHRAPVPRPPACGICGRARRRGRYAA